MNRLAYLAYVAELQAAMRQLNSDQLDMIRRYGKPRAAWAAEEELDRRYTSPPCAPHTMARTRVEAAQRMPGLFLPPTSLSPATKASVVRGMRRYMTFGPDWRVSGTRDQEG